MTYMIMYAVSIVAFVAIRFFKKYETRKVAGIAIFLGTVVPSSLFLSKKLSGSNYFYQLAICVGLISFALLLVFLAKILFGKSVKN